MNPKTETRILAAYGAARALADVVDGHSTLVVEVVGGRVICRAKRFGLRVGPQDRSLRIKR